MTIKHLSARRLRSLPVPVPPAVEQHRIVAAAARSMKMCDDLESRQQEQRSLEEQVRSSLLGELATASTASSLSYAWKRIQTNLEIVTRHPDGIDKIRGAILHLAMRGYLSEPSSTDESVDWLLDRAKKQKVEMLQSGRIRRPRKQLPQVSSMSKPFDLPSTWRWCRFTDVGELGRGKSKHQPRNDPHLYTDCAVPRIQTGDVAKSSGTITADSTCYNESGVAESRIWPEGTLCITIAARSLTLPYSGLTHASLTASWASSRSAVSRVPGGSSSTCAQ